LADPAKVVRYDALGIPRLARVDSFVFHACVSGHEHLRKDSREARTGLARALSKQGFCSRSAAWEVIRAGRVRVNGTIRLDPEFPVFLSRDKLQVDGQALAQAERIYLMLNKPRGLVTTASDEKGRPTVFRCFEGHPLPFIAPVGRLDQASEGLLLFTNDSAWADGITRPESHLDKTYHVQVNCVADEQLVSRLELGVQCGEEFLKASKVSVLREGEKNCWLEILLREGRNRQIRRELEALGVGVLRLVRVAIGPLKLGNLPKGQFRSLTQAEVKRLFRTTA
jgi:23S rRNA pseudouridine2605 synthase